MEQDDSPKMTPFDQLLSSEQLQMMKLMIPYVPPKNQRFLGIYVKFLELQQTISFFQNVNHTVYVQDLPHANASPADILRDIGPFLPPHLRQMESQITTWMNLFEMIEMMKARNATSEEGDDTIDPMSMMKQMLNSEQQELFQTYNTMFANDSTMEGGVNDDGLDE